MTNTFAFLPCCRAGRIFLLALPSLMLAGSLQAAGWNGPGQPRYGDFPPSDIDRQLQKEMDSVSRETERRMEQPSSQGAPVARPVRPADAPASSAGTASPVAPGGVPAPVTGAAQTYAAPPPGYSSRGGQPGGSYYEPYHGYQYGRPPYRGGRWNRNGASFSMPWGNNRRGSGFSMPWNSSGSSFSMPWENRSRPGPYGAYPGSGMHFDMPWNNRHSYGPYGGAGE